MQMDTLQMFDQARETAGISFIVRSGCRCEKHNKDEGGKKSSSHLFGHAGDIEVLSDEARYKIDEGLRLAGFNRIGHGQDFIHADNDPAKNINRIWVYK